MKSLGKGWVILEESFHTEEKKLIAILSPRKTTTFVANYIEQIYVDRFAYFVEKISFKKNRENSPFKIERGMINGTTISHGHDPIYNAYYSHKLERNGDLLLFHFNIFKGFNNKTEHSCEVKVA